MNKDFSLKSLPIMVFVSLLLIHGIASGQEFYKAASRIFVPGGGKTGQEACDALVTVNGKTSYAGRLSYVANHPYNPETPWNPESGTCYLNGYNPVRSPYDGARCEVGWKIHSQYGIGGWNRVDPDSPVSDTNPEYLYASPDMLCKRDGIDLAKNAGQPPCPVCTPYPIHIGTGNKYLREGDYRAAHGLSFERHYNYLGNPSGLPLQITTNQKIGNRWRGSYSRTLLFAGTPITAVSTVQAIRDDGRSVYFTRHKGQPAWLAEADGVDHLTELTDENGSRTGWSYYVAATGETEIYDSSGKLQSIARPTGITHTLVYSDGTDGGSSAAGGFVLDADGNHTSAILPAGLLLRVSDAYGRTLQFGYDALGRVLTLTEPEGNVIRYGYSVENSLVSVTYPDNKIRRYIYNEPSFTEGANLPGALTGIVDENGNRYVTYIYDKTGRAVDESFSVGGNNVNRYQLVFDKAGFKATVVDPLGAVRVYTFLNFLGVAKLASQSESINASGDAAVKALTYDAHGNVSSRTDFNGNKTTYTYDLPRNLEVKRVEAAGTPEARTIHTQWHASYRLPLQIAEPLRLTTHTYDAKGNLLSKTLQSTTDATGAAGFDAVATGTPRTWRYTYNEYGQVLTATGPRSDVDDTTRYTYDEQGNLSTLTNAAGHVTTLTDYDANGRAGRIIDPNGSVTALTYSPRGWLTARKVGNETTTYDYDGVGQLIKVTHPDGSQIAYTYDDAHRLTGIADSLGNRIDYTLDAMGNRTKEETRDPDGQLARQTTRIYDALNRLQQITGGMQ